MIYARASVVSHNSAEIPGAASAKAHGAVIVTDASDWAVCVRRRLAWSQLSQHSVNDIPKARVAV